MKITDIQIILTGRRHLFLKVITDEGLTGIGECGAWGYQKATAELLLQLKQHLIGMDPFRIEHIWNALNRCMHFRGSVIQGAISGIDIALWDLKGKYLGVPVYELMGGKTRDKIKIYVNVKGTAPEEIACNAKQAKEQGFHSIRFSIHHPRNENGTCGETGSALISRVEKTMGMVRETVGYDMDVAVEVHRSMRPAEAIAVGKMLEKYHPYFYEDPIPDNEWMMTQVAQECGIPIATGERFISIQEFDSLLTHTNVRYLRPDMCMVGGLTAGKKIAALAEAKGVYIIPHNPLGPISTAACLQLNACIPNFEVQEYPMFNGICRLDSEMKTPFKITDGYLELPDQPGLGVELIDDIESIYPYEGMIGQLSFHEDGSIVDR